MWTTGSLAKSTKLQMRMIGYLARHTKDIYEASLGMVQNLAFLKVTAGPLGTSDRKETMKGSLA